MSKRKSHGHYCYVCGRYRSNESFSGKNHSRHICKSCSKNKNKITEENLLNDVNEFDDEEILLVHETKTYISEEYEIEDEEIDPDDLPF